MESMKNWNLPPWEKLQKKLTIAQLGDLKGQRILDFGCGQGFLANYYAFDNQVWAIEPVFFPKSEFFQTATYTRLKGSVEQLEQFPTGHFDWIFCHNVLEYVQDKATILNEIARLLRPGGKLSLIKHNRAGRVMQMAVLLDDCLTAQALLKGENSCSSQYGKICYYTLDERPEIEMQFEKADFYGMRVFFDLQQNQEKHTDKSWQKSMLNLELAVSVEPSYQKIAFFHHHVLRKK